MTTIASATSALSTGEAQKDSSVLSANFDQFLTLLTTQMKYQDPLNPMESTEFTNQLVQYSQVEQQIKSNDYLEKVADYTKSYDTVTALGYVGLQIKHEGDTFKYAGGENGSIAMSYSLPEDATINTIAIKDSEGNTVVSAKGELGMGDYIFAWDGMDSNGDPVEAGVYTIEVNALNGSGKNITASTIVPGYVEGIQTGDNGGMELIVNGKYVPLSDVSSARL